MDDWYTVVAFFENRTTGLQQISPSRIRSVSRMTGVKRVQCDEIWSFCYAKDKNLPPQLQGKFGFGSVCHGQPSTRIAS
jgi:hypothetical protein